MFTPGDAGELLDRVKKLISQPRDAIMSIGMTLNEHGTKLFKREKIERKLLNILESLLN
jgi:hypothetical protein